MFPINHLLVFFLAYYFYILSIIGILFYQVEILDNFDRNILTLMQADASLSVGEIADRVALS